MSRPPSSLAELPQGTPPVVVVSSAPPTSVVSSSFPDLIPTASFTKDLCAAFASHGLACVNLDSRRTLVDVVAATTMNTSTNTSNTDATSPSMSQAELRRNFKSRDKWIRESDLYVPVIHADWFLCEESLLEFYFALKATISQGKPFILPVISSRLLAMVERLTANEDDGTKKLNTQSKKMHDYMCTATAGSNNISPLMKLLNVFAPTTNPDANATTGGGEGGRIREAANNAAKLIPWICEACYFLATDRTPQDVAALSINFLVELQLPIPEKSVARGDAIVEIFRDEFKRLQEEVGVTNKKPNSGVVAALERLPISTMQLRNTVNTLDLKQLFMSEIGLRALIPVLRMLPSLETLNLSTNGISNRTLHILCEALHQHPSIASINLSDNEISQAGVSDVYFLCQANPMVKHVDLTRNPTYSEVWMKRIEDQLVANRLRTGNGNHTSSQQQKQPATTAASSVKEFAQRSITMSSFSQRTRINVVAEWDKGSDSVELAVHANNQSFTRTVPTKKHVSGIKKFSADESIGALIANYLSTQVHANVLRLQRLNKKYIFHVPEGPATAGMSNSAASSTSSASPIETLARLVVLEANMLPEGLTVAPDSLLEVSVRLVCNDLSQQQPDKDSFFVEGSMVFLVVSLSGARGLPAGSPGLLLLLIAKSCPKMYKGRILNSSGNITDELSALLNRLYEVSVAVDGGHRRPSTSADDDGFGAVRESFAQDRKEEARQEAATANIVLGQWQPGGGGGGGVRHC